MEAGTRVRRNAAGRRGARDLIAGRLGSEIEGAPAKINLHLHVLGRTPSGLHRIDSALAFVDIFDVVRASPAPGLSLSVSGPMARTVDSLGAANYVMRAASELRERAGISAGAALHLEKHIPPGAGLAGGTADGAAALRALGRLWGISRRDPAMRGAASALGADGPACLESQACWAGGTGADLASMAAPTGNVLVAWPGTELATSSVYAGWRGPGSRPASRRRMPVRQHVARTANDLASSAARLAPVIRSVEMTLASVPGAQGVRMTGSGTAVFALFARRCEAEAAARQLRRARPGWWLRAASFLPRGRALGSIRSGAGKSWSCRRRVRR